MTIRNLRLATLLLSLGLLAPAYAADHNDPNQINAIFSTKDASGFHPTRESAADIYDIFGWPADDNRAGDERVILALTFAAVPKAGTLDPDLLYRILVYPSTRSVTPGRDNSSPAAFASFLKATEQKFNTAKKAEVRATVDKDGKATLSFIDFPGGSFTRVIPTNQNTVIQTPDGQSIKAYVGGRDDAFFNDLPGFFRSINYAPQFYHVSGNESVSAMNQRELPIAKTLLELEGNDLFNYTDAEPLRGLTGDPRARGTDIKKDLPAQGRDFKATRFKKDAQGNYRLVYTGADAQAGKNINAVILEVPLKFLSKKPQAERIVNVWSESWVIKAETKANQQEATNKNFFETLWAAIKSPFASKPSRAVADDVVSLDGYRLVDTDGQAFADAALTERWDDRQKGANNFILGPHLALRLAHLGWGFAPSIVALGLPTSFDFPVTSGCRHTNLKCLAEKFPVSEYREYTDQEGHDKIEKLPDALLRVKRTLFQELRMPNDSWKRNGVNVPLRRTFEVFLPNVNSIDMDTNGTWPFGRRPEDQVATRFLALFLDMNTKVGNEKLNVETLNDPALWQKAPIMPKVVGPNPPFNDKPFLKEFPYLAEPWTETGYYNR